MECQKLSARDAVISGNLFPHANQTRFANHVERAEFKQFKMSAANVTLGMGILPRIWSPQFRKTEPQLFWVKGYAEIAIA